MSQKPITTVRVPAAVAMTGIPRSTLYKMEAQGEFPRKVKLGGRSVGFYLHEIEEWLASRPRVADVSKAA